MRDFLLAMPSGAVALALFVFFGAVALGARWLGRHVEPHGAALPNGHANGEVLVPLELAGFVDFRFLERSGECFVFDVDPLRSAGHRADRLFHAHAGSKRGLFVLRRGTLFRLVARGLALVPGVTLNRHRLVRRRFGRRRVRASRENQQQPCRDKRRNPPTPHRPARHANGW